MKRGKENPGTAVVPGFSCGARGGSRTRTPLRALAPEASESTNSTTRACVEVADLLFSTRLMIPHHGEVVNTFFCNPYH